MSPVKEFLDITSDRNMFNHGGSNEAKGARAAHWVPNLHVNFFLVVWFLKDFGLMQDAGGNWLSDGSPVDMVFPAVFIKIVFVHFEEKPAAIFAYIKDQMRMVSKLFLKKIFFGERLKTF